MTVKFLPHVMLTGIVTNLNPLRMLLCREYMPVREVKVLNPVTTEPATRFEMLWTDKNDFSLPVHDTYLPFTMAGQCDAMKSFISLSSRLFQIGSPERLADLEAEVLARKALSESTVQVTSGTSLLASMMPDAEVYSRKSGFWLAKAGIFRDERIGEHGGALVKFEAVGKVPLEIIEPDLLGGVRYLYWNARAEER